MTIHTNITTNRKALANQISKQLLGAPVVYTGAPSFAYKVGTAVSIDRAGDIDVATDDALAILKPYFIEQGWFEAEVEDVVETDSVVETEGTTEVESVAEAEYTVEATEQTITVSDEQLAEEHTTIAATTNAPIPAPGRSRGIDTCKLSVPADLTVPQLINLIHILYSKQRLLNSAAMDGRLTIPEALITRLSEYKPDTLQAFSELLRDFIALGDMTSFDYADGIVHMDFPYDEVHPERWTVYAGLVGRIIRAAQDATRVKAELITTENEKYYMRVWLLRMGYGGVDMKDERKMLLKNLKGHSAFPDDAAALKHKEKYAALRKAEREVNAGD